MRLIRKILFQEKMCNVIELIIPDQESDNDVRGPLWPPEKTVSPESAVIGALEQAFWTMVSIEVGRFLEHFCCWYEKLIFIKN